MRQVEGNSAPRSCSYCHLSSSDARKKLKRCSRCHRAWYCNSECQKNHFAHHKKDCKRWAIEKSAQGNASEKKSTSNQSITATLPKTKFLVQKREGRGNCLVVAPENKINKGEWIRNFKSIDKDYWEPLILPVLHEEHRTSRCALCFGRLTTESCSFDHLPPNPLYRLSFCSKMCRRVASSNGLEQEEKDCFSFVQKLRGQGPNHIFSTAIVLYRILIRENRLQGDDAQILEQVHALQGKPNRERLQTQNSDKNAEDANDYHTRGVIAIAMGMLQSSSLSMSSQYRPSMDYLFEMVHRIKVNGFSIYSESHFETCGLGLYGTPSFLNHSCRANALQTFVFRPSSPPSLYITAYRDILPNQEIFISYTDTSRPSQMRRKKLEREYYFFCTCEACDTNSDAQDDSMTIALKCKNGCERQTTLSCSPVVREDRGMAPSRIIYECLECHSTNFESSLRQLKLFEQTMLGDAQFSNPSSAKTLHDTYKDLQTICYTSSWYVQEAGDMLLQTYLERLPLLMKNPMLERQTAREALKLAEDLLGPRTAAAPEIASTSAFLRRQHLVHKAAKLRLFLTPDPRQSIRELQEVLANLQPYFPRDHACIAEVKASLASAMM